jgi:hypothetical protein
MHKKPVTYDRDRLFATTLLVSVSWLKHDFSLIGVPEPRYPRIPNLPRELKVVEDLLEILHCKEYLYGGKYYVR